MRNNKTRIIGGVLVLAIVVSGIIFYLNHEPKQTAKKITETISVKQSDPLVFTGIVKSKKVQYLNFNQQLGETIFFEKQNGDEISKGDLIASYYSLEIKNSLCEKQTKKEKKQAEINTLKKNESKEEDNIAQLTNEIEQLEEEMKELKKYSVSKIYAEFSGVFTNDASANYEKGDSLGKITSDEEIIEFEASEYDIEKLGVGMSTKLEYVNQTKVIEGTISNISSISVNTTSKISSYIVDTTFTEKIPNGYHVQVVVPINELKVPLTSVKQEGENYYVYKKMENGFVKTKIEAIETANYFVIEKGLAENDAIAEKFDEVSNEEVKTK